MRIAPVLVVCLLVACGNSPSDSSGGTDAGLAPGDAGIDAGTPTPTSTLSGDVEVTTDLTIAVGSIVEVMPGTVFHAAAGTQVIVLGTLEGTGTTDSPIRFQSATHTGPGEWQGLTIKSGGTVHLSGFEVHDATMALNIEAGSSFTLDHFLVDTSSTMAQVNASGALTHGQMHGLGSAQASDTIDVANASPTFTDVVFSQAGPSSDLVHVDGTTSSPVFDHVELSAAHCAFHFNAGTKVSVSHSYVHDTVYGVMVLASKGTIVTESNWEKNSTQIGLCTGGNVDATNVYFDSSVFDATCTGQKNSSPAPTPITDVGARP